MEFHIEEIQTGNKAAWDAFVRESSQGSLFSTFLWKKILEAGIPFKQRIYALYEKDQILGGVVLTEKKQLGHYTALNALLSPYLGFLLLPSASTKISDKLSKEHEVLSSLIKFLEKRYAQIDLNNAPGLNDVRPFIQHHWQTIPRYTYYLNLANLNALWENFDGSVRRIIKKAQTSGLHVSHITGHPTEIFSLLEATWGKHRDINPIPESLVREIVTSGDLESQRIVIGAHTPEGKLISVIVCLWDWNRAYYLIAASEPEHLSTGVNSLLIWELAELLSKIPVTQLDFIGGNIPNIARFKETFNPQLINYYRTERWNSLLFKMIKKAGQYILRR